MRKILILISLVLFSALSFGQGAMMASVGASGGDYGPNMITNGTFDDGSDWTLDATYEITGGTLNYDNSASNSVAKQSFDEMVSSLESDSHYKLTFTISGLGRITFKNEPPGSTLIAQDDYEDDTYEIEFDTGTLSYYGFQIVSSIVADGSFAIDNIILQKQQ